MKLLATILVAFVTAPSAFAVALACQGTHGNAGSGKLEIKGQELRFVGTFVDQSIGINKQIRCDGGRGEKGRSNPVTFDAAGSCDAYTKVLFYSSGVLMLVDDSRRSEPEVTASYFCR